MHVYVYMCVCMYVFLYAWRKEVPWSSSKFACLQCFEIHASYPHLTWTKACEEVRGFPRGSEGTRAVDGARQRLDASRPSPLDMKDEQVYLENAIDMEVVTRYPIFNETEFLRKHRCSMKDAGVATNGTVRNADNEEEDVLVCKPVAPRELIVRSRVGTTLRQSWMRRFVREGQGVDTYTWGLKDHDKKRPLCLRGSRRRSKMMTLKQVKKCSLKHMRKVRRREKGPDDAAAEQGDELEGAGEDCLDEGVPTNRVPSLGDGKRKASGKSKSKSKGGRSSGAAVGKKKQSHLPPRRAPPDWPLLWTHW